VNGIITYRNLIQWCAGIMGTNAWMDWNGQLQFSWYTTTSSYTALPSNRFSSDLHEDAITITGVQYTNAQGVTLVAGTADYALDLTGNYLAASGISEILSNLNTALNGFSYTPFTASVINAPYLWPMDGVTYRDKDGNDHACILTNVNLCINGATMLAGKGETSETNKGVKPSGMTTEQAQLVTQAMAQVETDIDESLTQEDIFNRLTDNGAAQGMVLYNGQLYINANYINAGYLSANRIQGGTLTLGGANNVNGQMELLDADGNTVAVLNNAGIDITDGTIVAYTSDRLGRVMLSNGELTFQHYGQDSGTGQYMWLDTLSLSMDSVYSLSQLSSDELPLFISARNKTITLRNNFAPSIYGCQIIMGADGVLTLKTQRPNGLTITMSDTVDVSSGTTSLFSIDDTGFVRANTFSGNLWGNAFNITGIAAIANGGTGADNAPDALDNLGIKYTTVTGTTNANGNVSLGLDSRRYSVVSVKSTATNYIALPYANTSGAYLWQAHVRDNYAAHSVVANTAVTLLVTYIDFGSNVLT
jgi:hypothetical protein